MRDWIPIGVQPQPLTEGEKRVKELLDKGMNYVAIAALLRMSHETTKDMIYEIRKKEGIERMSKGVPITDEMRNEIVQLSDAGLSAPKIAARLGCGINTVYRATKKSGKPAQINPEFDAAVNDMIAEVKSEKAEQKSAIAEPEKLPGVVCRAIDAGFHYLAEEIDKRRNRIEEIEAEIAEFEKDIAALRKWREAHK